MQFNELTLFYSLRLILISLQHPRRTHHPQRKRKSQTKNDSIPISRRQGMLNISGSDCARCIRLGSVHRIFLSYPASTSCKSPNSSAQNDAKVVSNQMLRNE